MAGNFNFKFNGNTATNIEHYECAQSNLTHSASKASINSTEMDYGDAEDFDYENYLAENLKTQEEVKEEKIPTELIERTKNELMVYGFVESDIERLLTGQITLQDLHQEIENDSDDTRRNKIYGSNGFVESDRERLLKNQISLEDLYQEIENDTDGTRRRKIYELNYLKSLGLEVTSIEELKNDIQKTKEEIFAKRQEQSAFDFTEEEAALGLIRAMDFGNGRDIDIDELANFYIVAQGYEDEYGVEKYEYRYNANSNLYTGGGIGSKVIHYNDLFKDSTYFKKLKESLVAQERTKGAFFWAEDYISYEWQWTDEQTKLYEEIYEKAELAQTNREKKIEEYQKEIDSLISKQLQEEAILEYINQELDHYMENIDQYVHQTDFMDKCGMNEDLRNRTSEIVASMSDIIRITGNGRVSPLYPINDKENGMAVIAAIINKTGDFSYTNGVIYGKNLKIEISLTDNLLEHYEKWLQFMQESEILVFNYIYNTEGSEKAYEYLESIADVLDNRWLLDTRQKDAAWATENAFNATLASIGSIFMTPFEGMGAALHSLGSMITGDEIRRIDVYSRGDTYRSAVSQSISENYGEGWAFLYSTGMSMADSITLIAASYATGGLMSGAGVTSKAVITTTNVLLSADMMGSRSYVSTLNDALDRGLSDGKAMTLAFSSAAVETLMESYSLGHLVNLEGKLGEASVNMVKRLTANISNPKLQKIAINSGYFVLGTLSQAFCEGEEELCTEVLNHYIDEMISGELSNYNLSIYHHMLEGMGEEEARRLANEEYHDQLQQAFAGGFLSGGVFGGVKIGISEFVTSRKIAKAINTEYKVMGLTELEQIQKNQILASVLEIDSKYQNDCINALTGNLTQEQMLTMDGKTLLAINDAVNNYQRYDSSVTLENIFKNVFEVKMDIENDISQTSEYQAPNLKDIFDKLVNKKDSNIVGSDYIENLPLQMAEKQNIKNLITQYEQMPSFQNVTLPTTVAMRLIEHSFTILDQKTIGKQYCRAAYFYLLNSGIPAQNAANIVSAHVRTILDQKTNFYTQYDVYYGFKMNFSLNMDASKRSAMLNTFQQNFSMLPDHLKQQVKEVNFYDTYNPGDVYWEVNYNIDNFESAATGGSGVINLWTGNPTLELLAHEIAHSYDTACVASWGLNDDRISTSAMWLNAMQEDNKINGKTGVSDYAVESKSSLEDFADSVALYVSNPSILDAFPNRKKILQQYFKSSRLTQLSADMNTISQIITSKYGYKFEDVLVGYYVYGAKIESELEQFLSKYTASEMYSVVGFEALLEQKKTYNSSDYQQIIPQAIDNLVQKYGLTQAVKIMSDYLNSGQASLLTRDYGIRFDITKFGLDGLRQYVSSISNGSLNVQKLFSKYYLKNEINVIKDIMNTKYGEQAFEQVIYEHFIYDAQIDSEIAAYVDKYSAYDFMDVLNLQNLDNTARLYSLNHYKQSFEKAMDTLIEKYGITQAVTIFEEYLKTGDKFLLTRDNNIRFEISKFTIEDLKSYLQGTYNGKGIQTIFSEYQISKNMGNIQNQITTVYGNQVDMQSILYQYYVHGAKLESSIEAVLSNYTASDISSVLGIDFDSFSEYTTADYESAILLALQTLIDKHGFQYATQIIDDFLDTGNIFELTRDNNVRFELGKFDLTKLNDYVSSNNMTLLVLQNIDIQKIDTSLIDLSSLTTEQIQQYLGQCISQGVISNSDGYLAFSSKDQLSIFFGDVPSNIRERLEHNIESDSPKTLLEFRETLDLSEQQQLDNYLQNTVEGRWLSTLTSQEIYAVNLYTKSDYLKINSELREKSVFKYFNVIQSIDSALSKYSLSEDTVLWRGIDYSGFSHLGITDYAGLQALVGGTYSDLGYMSASPAYDSAFSWQPIMFKIKTPAGTTGAYVNQLSNYYNIENEFLLGRGQELTIESVTRQTIDGVNKIIIEATITNNIAQALNTMISQVNTNNMNVVNNSINTNTVDSSLQALSEYEKSLLFGYTITGAEDTKSPGVLMDVFDELDITSPIIPLNVLNAISLNSSILADVLNEQISICDYDSHDLKLAVESYITSSLKLMEQNSLFDYELINSVMDSSMSSSITQDFVNKMLENSLEQHPFETYDILLSYLGLLDSDSKYYYLLEITGLNLDNSIKVELLEKLFEEQELKECAYNHASIELEQSMYDTFGITDKTVINSLLESLLGSKDAFLKEGIANSNLDWNHFVQLLSPYIKEKIAIYDPSKPPVLWSKVDCSQLNEKYTTIENSTIGEGLYFLDLIFANWNSDNFSTPKLETLWNLLSQEFASDLCQMKMSENGSQTLDNLKFIFPGVDEIGGPFGDIFKNVEFIEILKNQNVKTLTLEAVLSEDVFTSKVPSVTINLDYFRQLLSSSNSSYSYDVVFEEFKGIVAAEFLNNNFGYFESNATIVSLMNNLTTGNNTIAFTAFKNYLTDSTYKLLFGGTKNGIK